MKKLLLLLSLLLSFPLLKSQDPVTIVFPDDALYDHLYEEVVFDQTLYVCGRYGEYLYLAPERLRCADETELLGSAGYAWTEQRNEQLLFTLYCPYVNTDDVRTGSTISQLKAFVVDSTYVVVNDELVFENNVRPTTPPDVGDAQLTICCANLQYYCPDWEDTYSYAESDTDYQRQHDKIMKAFVNINADIYALEEVQTGQPALDSLVNGLNARTAPGRYAYVQDEDHEVSSFTKVAYLYRTDKVVPQMPLQHPYSSNSYYHLNEYVQAFADIENFERFVLNVNHFKAKDGTGSESTNGIRMENVKKLTSFLQQKLDTHFFNDDDILIVGDLNCGTMEPPIRHLDSLGYVNQMTRFDSASYSYVYNCQVGFLDHVFASPSMSQQVTGVAVYHLNADESWYHSYSYGDTTMYRFSDHDPVIIGLALKDPQAIADHAAKNHDEQALIYAYDHVLHVSSNIAGTLAVYDLLGRQLDGETNVSSYSASLPTGVYIVRFNRQIKKIVIP